MTRSWKLRQAGAAPSQRGSRHRAEIAFVHRRTAHFGRRHAGRGRDRVDHHACERALAQLAHQQPQQEFLLVLGGASEQLRNAVARCALEPLPRIAASSSSIRSTS